MKHCATCRCVTVKPPTTMQKALGPRAQAWLMDYLLTSRDGWQTVKQITKGIKESTGVIRGTGTTRCGLKRLVLARFVEKTEDFPARYRVANREGWRKLLGIE